jgi:hypothetical protein
MARDTREKRDLHALNADGMVLCNPRDRGEPMTALGRGEVDVARILGAISRPADWVVELDECATDPLEAARQSRVYLESLPG